MVGPKPLFVDGERAAKERLCLGKAVGGLEQPGQVGEGKGVLRIVLAVLRLGQGDGALRQGQGIGKSRCLEECVNPPVQRVDIIIRLPGRRAYGADRAR
jgi:hypothetical protein